jgi:DNA-binding CsgD family transcriptional regulator
VSTVNIDQEQIQALEQITEIERLQQRHAEEIQELKQAQKRTQSKVMNRTIIAFSIGFALLVVTVFFVARSYRFKRKALELNQKNVERLALKIKRESDWIDNLIELNDKIKKNQVADISEEIQELVNDMRDNLIVDKHRQVRAKNIEVISNEFREKLRSRYPNLTKTDIEMCELIRLDMSNSEISRVRNISQNSARMARYRLKKKLNLEENQSVYDALKQI